jgi:XRE family transcriptional regulator, regulator of sulfur utilization
MTRRDLAWLLPALAAAQSPADSNLLSKVYHSDKIPYAGDEKKKGRAFFRGAEHSGFHLEAHETILGPGTETHAPHKHEHEEIVILVEGTLETFVDGKTEPAEAGSIIYLASNQMHSVRNIGKAACRYYVIELRGKG